MTERPILMNGAMVCATLRDADPKTQTRRVIAQQPADGWAFDVPPQFGRITSQHPKKDRFGAFIRCGVGTDFPQLDLIPCPYGEPGDRLWVRETWRGVVEINPPGKSIELGVARYVPDQEYCRRVEYQATQERDGDPWRPSIHMPRWASRITLEVTGVRVERLQDISEADAAAEGVESLRNEGEYWKHYLESTASCDALICLSARESFRTLWDSLAAPGADWDTNPWVWVIEFRRITP